MNDISLLKVTFGRTFMQVTSLFDVINTIFHAVSLSEWVSVVGKQLPKPPKQFDPDYADQSYRWENVHSIHMESIDIDLLNYPSSSPYFDKRFKFFLD